MLQSAANLHPVTRENLRCVCAHPVKLTCAIMCKRSVYVSVSRSLLLFCSGGRCAEKVTEFLRHYVTFGWLRSVCIKTHRYDAREDNITPWWKLRSVALSNLITECFLCVADVFLALGSVSLSSSDHCSPNVQTYHCVIMRLNVLACFQASWIRGQLCQLICVLKII